ncbi:hypothetical protein ACWDKQ_32030 [Saccharopolyspora sp. NPDC000995]
MPKPFITKADLAELRARLENPAPSYPQMKTCGKVACGFDQARIRASRARRPAHLRR